MNLGLFQEPAGGVADLEVVTAVMADSLQRDHEVEIARHRLGLIVTQSEKFFSLDLGGVCSRYVPPPVGNDTYSKRYLLAARRTGASEWPILCRPYNLFVANVHGPPPKCCVQHGVQHVLLLGFAKARNCLYGRTSGNKVGCALGLVRHRVNVSGRRDRVVVLFW